MNDMEVFQNRPGSSSLKLMCVFFWSTNELRLEFHMVIYILKISIIFFVMTFM